MENNQTITTFAEAETRLADRLPGYEQRPHQQALARAIEDSLDTGRHLMGQAGCGTGKSLATLIPAVLSGRRTVVATATKSLQDQLAFKDLPFLKENLGVDFSFALLKGRSNYLCLAAYNDPDTVDRVNHDAMREIAVAIKGSQENPDAFDGERDSLSIGIEDKEWRALTMSSEECPGKKKCPFGAECYAERAKQKAKEANVVVVNHALLCMDSFIKDASFGYASMLGEFDVLIVDEAHELRNYATNTLTSRFSPGSFRSLVAEVRNFALDLRDDEQFEVVQDIGADLLVLVNHLWTAESSKSTKENPRLILQPGRVHKATITDDAEAWVNVATKLMDYRKAILGLKVDNVEVSKHDAANIRKSKLAGRVTMLSARFNDLCSAPFDALVRWVEEETFTSRRGDKTTDKVIKTAPVEVGPILNRWFFSNDVDTREPITSVLVSATLSTKEGPEGFDFMGKALGVGDYTSIDVGTPFDFEKQARLFIPADMPHPSKNRQAWEAATPSMLLSLVKASRGRALLLFTSIKQMKAAYEFVSARVPYKCMMQGQKPNKALAAEFTEDESSVLFGTSSFFTGVDFQGDTCSLVSIDKLPFPVPTEPMIQARCENIVSAGGNDFRELVMPEMTLPLLQGFGRLIRHANDRGVVAILDPRLMTENYGKQIVRALPDAKLVKSLQEVQAFYEEGALD